MENQIDFSDLGDTFWGIDGRKARVEIGSTEEGCTGWG